VSEGRVRVYRSEKRRLYWRKVSRDGHGLAGKANETGESRPTPPLGEILGAWHLDWSTVRMDLPKGRGLCLDLGCGSGRERAKIESKGWTWVGFDIDPARGGAMLVGDAGKLPFEDHCFEVVLMRQVLEHLPQPWIALKEVQRVLKPGGYVLGSVSCLEPLHDVNSYFGFTHRGLNRMLKDCDFVDIGIHPGLNAFSLMARSWLGHLLGPRLGERLGFFCVRVSFVTMLSLYLPLRRLWNLGRRGGVGGDFQRTLRWLVGEAPLEFAGHLIFQARRVP